MQDDTAYTGEIRLFAGTRPPPYWVFCDGQILTIPGNPALYSLLGNQYGGDGRTNFKLPDLNGRAALGEGQRPGGSVHTLGEKGGHASVSLTGDNLPKHTHRVKVSSAAGNTDVPTGSYLAAPEKGTYAYATLSGGVPLAGDTIGQTGEGKAFDNRQPSLGLNYIICIDGLFPTRS